MDFPQQRIKDSTVVEIDQNLAFAKRYRRDQLFRPGITLKGNLDSFLEGCPPLRDKMTKVCSSHQNLNRRDGPPFEISLTSTHTRTRGIVWVASLVATPQSTMTY